MLFVRLQGDAGFLSGERKQVALLWTCDLFRRVRSSPF